MTQSESQSFEEVKDRLDEIVEAVSDENIALDDALALYEEAVKLGLQASALLEENLEANNARYDEEQSDDQEIKSDPDGEMGSESDSDRRFRQDGEEPSEDSQDEELLHESEDASSTHDRSDGEGLR